jgi:hypothetical protein
MTGCAAAAQYRQARRFDRVDDPLSAGRLGVRSHAGIDAFFLPAGRGELSLQLVEIEIGPLKQDLPILDGDGERFGGLVLGLHRHSDQGSNNSQS